MTDKVVLAYSGGLDTSVAVPWLKEQYGYDVIAVTVDVGQEKDVEAVKEKALASGAVKAYVVDARDEFAKHFVLPALKANALYEGIYPLSAALSRPLISSWLVRVAAEEGAIAVAHGCTGKGNDQVRFDVSATALAPDIRVIAPVREWPLSRHSEIEYAKAHGIPLPIGKENPFSIDQNLWGRSIECGELEDPWNEPPEEAFLWTANVGVAPATAEYVQITFEEGAPVALNGVKLPLAQLILKLNELAGKHGIGRIDHVENRLVGIKSREVYEAPAAVTLIAAHKALEALVLTREVAHAKPWIEQQYAQLIYNGLWFSPLREALDGFIAATQTQVTGEVRIKLWKGTATVVGRQAAASLYNPELATYGAGDRFNHQAAEGFITLWGLPTKVYAMAKGVAPQGVRGAASVSLAKGAALPVAPHSAAGA